MLMILLCTINFFLLLRAAFKTSGIMNYRALAAPCLHYAWVDDKWLHCNNLTFYLIFLDLFIIGFLVLY